MSLHDDTITEEENDDDDPEIESTTSNIERKQQQQLAHGDDCVIIDDAGVLHIRNNCVNFHVRSTKDNSFFFLLCFLLLPDVINMS